MTGNKPKYARLPFLRLKWASRTLFKAEEFLREIDPMPWYRAITGLVPHLGIEDPEVQQKMGEETALRMLCRIVPNLANAANM